MKLLSILLFTPMLFATDAPIQQKPITFNSAKPVCSVINGKLVLEEPWPLGSWKDCANSLLSIASQMDAQLVSLTKQLQDKSAPKTK